MRHLVAGPGGGRTVGIRLTTRFHPHPGKLAGTAPEPGKYDLQIIGCMRCQTVGAYGGTLGANLRHVAPTGVSAAFGHSRLTNPAKTLPGAAMPRLRRSPRQMAT